MLPQASWTWHKLENPSACGGLGCAAGRWMTPDPSLKGWLLKDGGQLWHLAESLCSPEQLPQHNPSQRWSQSIQCSSLIITYTSLKEIIVLQPSKWSWLMVNTVIEIQKNWQMESEIYLTKQTLISWLSALIPWCFFFLKFHGLYFCFVFPSLVFFFPFIICPHWVALLTQWTCRAVMAPWQHADDLGGLDWHLLDPMPSSISLALSCNTLLSKRFTRCKEPEPQQPKSELNGQLQSSIIFQSIIVTPAAPEALPASLRHLED